MGRYRILRLGAAALLLAAVVRTLAPHATSYVSSSAVVNSPLIDVRSPFDGRIAAASPEIARPVRSGQRLLEVAADRQSRNLLEELAARRSVLDARIRATAAQRDALTAISAALADREKLHEQQAALWLGVRVREAEAEIRATEAKRREIADRLARARRLAEAGALADAALTGIEAEHDEAVAQIERLTARRDAYALERAALAKGVVVDLGAGDGVYARQRRDEIAIRLADLDAESARLAAERGALGARIAETRRAFERSGRFAPTASSSGVVWRASPAPGAEVLTGDEVLQLLDCDRRFIEVAVPERHFDDIRPGRPALVRLKGASEDFVATVAAVRGSGGKFEHPKLAAETPEVVDGQLRVLIRLAPPPLRSEEDRARLAATFCDVGRTAEVRFERPLPAGLKSFAEFAVGAFGAALDLAGRALGRGEKLALGPGDAG